MFPVNCRRIERFKDSIAHQIESKTILFDRARAIADGISMTTTILSSKGQVVLPRLVRSKLHLFPGTKLVCEIQGDSVILTPERPRLFIKEYIIDPQTGLRVTKAFHDSEPVTSEMIKTLLEDDP
jgi:AbrB family looped-hinge helix DNA binding protein